MKLVKGIKLDRFNVEEGGEKETDPNEPPVPPKKDK